MSSETARQAKRWREWLQGLVGRLRPSVRWGQVPPLHGNVGHWEIVARLGQARLLAFEWGELGWGGAKRNVVFAVLGVWFCYQWIRLGGTDIRGVYCSPYTSHSLTMRWKTGMGQS